MRGPKSNKKKKNKKEIFLSAQIFAESFHRTVFNTEKLNKIFIDFRKNLFRNRIYGDIKFSVFTL